MDIATSAGLKRAHAWREELPWYGKTALALAMALVTGLLAQVRIPLPFTPVPVTGQVFAVLLAGALLGGGYGALSQLLYVALGSAGVSWFAVALWGPTGGYLLGFVPAALLVGRVTESCPRARRFGPLALVMLAAVGVIYLAGAVQFALFMGTGWEATLAGAVLPFIPADLAKALAAAAVGSALLPRTR